MAGIIFTNGTFQGIGNDGKVIPYGRLYFTRCCDGGDVITYRDSQLSSRNPNPIILSSSGKADVYLVEGTYNVSLTDKNGVPVWTIPSFEPSGGSANGIGGDVVQWRENFIAVTGQRTFQATREIGNASIYLNGVLLTKTLDYTIASVVLTLNLESETGDELSMVGADGVASDIILPDVVARANTIASLADVDLTIYSCVIVQEAGRGGIFNVVLDGKPDDEGTVFGDWHRAYEGAVKVSWFGDTTLEQTFKNASDVSQSVEVNSGDYVFTTTDIDFTGIKFHSFGEVTTNGLNLVVTNLVP